MNLNELLTIAVQHKASDLHILPDEPPLLRIDGRLAPISKAMRLNATDTKDIIYSALSHPQQQAFEQELVMETALNLEAIGNFRASLFHQLHGVAGVFRVIPEEPPSFEELLLPQVLKSLLTLTQGLILVTGPTGSGKSTTLAAMIEYINTFRACNIITIEDPIEYVFRSKKSIFNQIQVGRDTPDFATALRASLRQDPNVVLLGELRDLETMRLALTAAETGHLVMATLHAYSAPIAINRFADVFPTEEKNRVRSLLAETLQAVICQTLVKRTSGGRAAAFEILLMNNSVRHYIRQDMPSHIESAMQINSGKGMCTLEQYLHSLVAKGIINKAAMSNVLANRNLPTEMIKIKK